MLFGGIAQPNPPAWCSAGKGILAIGLWYRPTIRLIDPNQVVWCEKLDILERSILQSRYRSFDSAGYLCPVKKSESNTETTRK